MTKPADEKTQPQTPDHNMRSAKDGKTPAPKIPGEIQRIMDLEKEINLAYEKISVLEKEIEDGKLKALRSLADAQNMRRRMDEERGQLRFESTKDILLAILPSLDNFDRAMNAIPDVLRDHDWSRGIIAIEKGMVEELSKQGVTPIEALGSRFDPNLHHAIMIDSESEEGKIVAQHQKGYFLHGKVLRPAQVTVGGKNV